VNASGTEFGRPHLHFRLTDSTNERARELATAGAPSGSIVTAAEQSAGRGRRGRVWSAPPEAALLCSAILRPLTELHMLLPLAIPIAVCEAIEAVGSRRCEIKWPNDVWIDERKVAGVLIEARPPEFAVIGVGVNVAVAEEQFPADLRWPATSVGGGATVEDLRRALCDQLEAWVDAPADRVLAAYRGRDALLGRQITWDGGSGTTPSGAGIVEGVDDAGSLVALTPAGGRVALGSGEVQLAVAGRAGAKARASGEEP
jgi:BirA family biotin operon repressor/biotin-[acetyl-CoA-carboxylase] ligase